MAITYHAGRRIQGLSTDYNTTPTETNDFSTTATESKSGSSISIHGGVLGGDYVPTGSSQCSTVDPLGTTLSNTSWVARFKLTINAITNPSAETNLASIGFFATNGASGSGNEDSIVMAFWNNSSGSKEIRLGYTNNSFPASLTDKVTFTKQMAVETLYIELVRISDTSCKASLYSDSGYSSLIESQTLSISAGVCTNLRYFGGKNWNRSALTGAHDIDVDDLYIWNNTSTSPLLPKSALINVQVGSRLEETDSRKIYFRMGANAYVSADWYELGTVPYAGGRGVFGGGSDGAYTTTMEYITIATPSNATDFGDLTVARLYVEAVSSITRGVFGGGWNGSANEDTMDYITFATPSNATDFGNLTVARHAVAGVSSGTRGVFGGGNGSNVMDYITIATPSNATDFGDLTVTRQDLAGVSSDTRGVFAGGDTSNVMDYITISTAGNATDFGDLLSNLRYPADISNGTRGVFAGGDPNSAQGNTNVIQYITIATTGNATDFGDLTVGRHAPAGVESDTRGVIGGGATGSGTGAYSNVMDYITIATTGNATDFGDLTAATNHLGGASRF